MTFYSTLLVLIHEALSALICVSGHRGLEGFVNYAYMYPWPPRQWQCGEVAEP